MNADNQTSVPINELLSLTNTFQSLHAVGFGWTHTVKSIHAVNVTAGAVTLSICVCKSGASPSAANALLWQYSIPANDFIEFGENVILTACEIKAAASQNNGITLFLSGVEQ